MNNGSRQGTRNNHQSRQNQNGPPMNQNNNQRIRNDQIYNFTTSNNRYNEMFPSLPSVHRPTFPNNRHIAINGGNINYQNNISTLSAISQNHDQLTTPANNDNVRHDMDGTSPFTLHRSDFSQSVDQFSGNQISPHSNFNQNFQTHSNANYPGNENFHSDPNIIPDSSFNIHLGSSNYESYQAIENQIVQPHISQNHNIPYSHSFITPMGNNNVSSPYGSSGGAVYPGSVNSNLSNSSSAKHSTILQMEQQTLHEVLMRQRKEVDDKAKSVDNVKPSDFEVLTNERANEFLKWHNVFLIQMRVNALAHIIAADFEPFKSIDKPDPSSPLYAGNPMLFQLKLSLVRACENLERKEIAKFYPFSS